MWAYYEVPFETAGLTAAIIVAELTPATNKPIVITDLVLKATSELAEAQEEWLEIEIQRGGTAMTSGNGSAVTPIGDTPGLPTPGFTAEHGATTLTTYTSGTTPFRDAFQVRAGLEWHFTPEAGKGCHAGNGGMDVRLPNAPADAIDIKGTLTVAEWV